MTRQLYRLRVADHAAVVLRTLHPNIKRKIKAALHAITADPFTGKALGDELSGLISCRVSRFRIVYRVAQDKVIEIIAIGPRERIYEETFRLISKDT